MLQIFVLVFAQQGKPMENSAFAFHTHTGIVMVPEYRHQNNGQTEQNGHPAHINDHDKGDEYAGDLHTRVEGRLVAGVVGLDFTFAKNNYGKVDEHKYKELKGGGQLGNTFLAQQENEQHNKTGGQKYGRIGRPAFSYFGEAFGKEGIATHGKGIAGGRKQTGVAGTGKGGHGCSGHQVGAPTLGQPMKQLLYRGGSRCQIVRKLTGLYQTNHHKNPEYINQSSYQQREHHSQRDVAFGILDFFSHTGNLCQPEVGHKHKTGGDDDALEALAEEGAKVSVHCRQIHPIGKKKGVKGNKKESAQEQQKKK